MKRQSYIDILLCACLILSCTNQALETADKTPKKGNKPGSYQAMDYGPVLSESIRLAGPDSSLVRKGLAIRLDHNAVFIFDTDLVGMAAGTAGGWLDISKTAYANHHRGTDVAAVEGQQVFSSSDQLAGWAKGGSFKARREDGMGNLPMSWAHYKGYYRYGNKVLLSYSVGGTDVLELPDAVKYKGALTFSRTIKIAKTDHSMEALMLKMHDSWSVERTTDHKIILDTGTSALAVYLANAPEGVKLKVEKKGLITLQVSPSDSSQMIRVGISKLDSLDNELLQEMPEHLENTTISSFETMMQGGPSQWNKMIKTPGILSEKDSGYVLDQIPVPFKNPWGSWMRLTGLDFFDDGRAAVSTQNGDVWIVSGLDKSLKNVTWHRFASGLFYPMGVAVVDEQIYITERSQLTRLHDLNGDGEADYYENFNNDGLVYPMAHSLGLKVDSQGYFYFFKNGNRVPSGVPQHGSLIQVSPDGTRREVYARGFRGANTLGIGPDDNILTVDQEGNWVPAERMSMVETKGGFYGYRPHGGEARPVGEFKVPVAWFPHTLENSAGFMIYASDSRWGPLAGHWIMSSYGRRTLFEVLMEEIDGRFQGGIVQLPIKSKSGAMRASINPSDGQLYMVGLGSWGSTATIEGSFERIRYTGGDVSLPKALRVTPSGVKITFSRPLNSSSATNAKNYEVERWEYIYSKYYGSPEMSLSHPEQSGHDSLAVSSVAISKDGQEVYLKINDMRSVMQMEIAYNLKFSDGEKAVNTIYHTVNWLSVADTDKKPEWQQRILSGMRDSFMKREENFNRNQRLISENECKSCHAVSGKSFGPSFTKIARKYKNDQEIIDQLSNKIIEGGVGNWGQQVMPPHPNVTRLNAEHMVNYILSLSNDK